VWVTSAPDGTVTRLNAADLSPQAVIPVGRGPVSVAVGHDMVWVVNMVDGTVSAVDPQTNAVVATVPVGRQPFGIAAGATAVWVTNTLDGTVSRIEEARRSVSATYPVGTEPVGVVEWLGGVWVTNHGRLVRLDPSSGLVTASVPVGIGILGVAAGPVTDAASSDGSVEVLVAVNPDLRAYRIVVAGQPPGEARSLADVSAWPLVAAGKIVFPTAVAGADPRGFHVTNLAGA
jgi:YVTN family beta-propeller protein